MNKARRANEDYVSTKRDANRARRTNEDCLATKRDANKARIHKLRANEDSAATKRDANKVRSHYMSAKLRADKRNGDPIAWDLLNESEKKKRTRIV